MTIEVASAKRPNAIPVLRTWWIESGPRISTASPRASWLETTAFVSWSAAAAAIATTPSSTHWAAPAASERWAPGIGCSALVAEPTRTSSGGRDGRSASARAGSLIPVPRGACIRDRASRRGPRRAAPPGSAGHSEHRSRTSRRRSVRAPRRSRARAARRCPPATRPPPGRASRSHGRRGAGRPRRSTARCRRRRPARCRARPRGPSTGGRGARRDAGRGRRPRPKDSYPITRSAREPVRVGVRDRWEPRAALRVVLLPPLGPSLRDDLERRSEDRLDAPRLRQQPLLLRDRVADQAATLGARLGHGHLGLAARLLLHVVRGALGRDERRAEERLELDVTGDLGLERVHALAELGPLAPHGFEAVRDLVDLPADVGPPVAEDPAPKREVPHFHRCQ